MRRVAMISTMISVAVAISMGRRLGREQSSRRRGHRVFPVATMINSHHRVGGKPLTGGDQGEHQRRDDRGRRHPGGMFAMVAHLRTKEEDRDKRRQGRQPCKTQQCRDGCVIHSLNAGTGRPLTP